MTAPIEITDLIPASAGALFEQLRDELRWVRHGTTPRMEYYVNKIKVPYTYGKEEFARTYHPQPEHNAIECVRVAVEMYTGVEFEVCFLNRYVSAQDHLGWHSDNSPEMDDERPIAIVSLGAEREIMFRDIPFHNGIDYRGMPAERHLLTAGSLCVMAPGMQDTHQHRLPKSGRQCGERISLTFRGYKV